MVLTGVEQKAPQKTHTKLPSRSPELVVTKTIESGEKEEKEYL